MRCQAQLAKLGITAHWMRPPYGAFDRGVVKDIKGADMTPVLWSVDPRDWEQPGIGKIESRVLGAAGNGSVILMHSTNAQTVAALPRIIETLKARGYQFLTISQWETAASGHGVPETAPAPLVRIPKTPKTAPSLRQVEPLPSLPAPVGPIGPGLLAHAEPAVSAAADVELRGDSVDDVAISAPPLEIATADGEPAAEPAPESVPAAAEPQPASPVAAPVTEPQMAALPVPGPWLHVISNFDAAGELLGSLFIGPLQPSQPR